MSEINVNICDWSDQCQGAPNADPNNCCPSGTTCASDTNNNAICCPLNLIDNNSACCSGSGQGILNGECCTLSEDKKNYCCDTNSFCNGECCNNGYSCCYNEAKATKECKPLCGGSNCCGTKVHCVNGACESYSS